MMDFIKGNSVGEVMMKITSVTGQIDTGNYVFENRDKCLHVKDKARDSEAKFGPSGIGYKLLKTSNDG